MSLRQVIEHRCTDKPKVKEYETVTREEGFWFWKRTYNTQDLVWKEKRHLLWDCPVCGSEWEYEPSGYLDQWRLVKDHRGSMKNIKEIYNEPLTSTRWVE